jgi:hypothetical protein
MNQLPLQQQRQQLFLGIPALKRTQAGIDHAAMTTNDVAVSSAQWSWNVFRGMINQIKNKVIVATPDHVFEYVQDALSRDHRHIALNPGIYYWNQALHIS